MNDTTTEIIEHRDGKSEGLKDHSQEISERGPGNNEAVRKIAGQSEEAAAELASEALSPPYLEVIIEEATELGVEAPENMKYTEDKITKEYTNLIRYFKEILNPKETE